MRYALRTLWYERRRYLPGVAAVSFSAVLIALQAGILWGLIGVVAVPILNSSADIWVMYPNTLAADLGRPIPTYWDVRLWGEDDVVAVDEYIQGASLWTTDSGRTELVLVMGCNINPMPNSNPLGPIKELDSNMRSRLTEPGTVVLDRGDRHRLEITQAGQVGEVGGQRVRVVGFVNDMGSLTGPYVLCSIETARKLLHMNRLQTTYLLAKVKDKEKIPHVVEQLNRYPKMSALPSDEFSLQSRWHWIRQTKAGIAVLFLAFLGLGVGASVTSQTLYAATAASIRELAVLRALGLPSWRLKTFVMQQSLLVGLLGLLIGIPLTFALAEAAKKLGTNAELPFWLLVFTVVITIVMALVSGLIALRSLNAAEPASLLR